MIDVRSLTGEELLARLDDVARLRIEVFRAFPYLYDGNLEYERSYMRAYRDSPRAVVVAAFAGGQVVGVATGTPLSDHNGKFIEGFRASGYDPAEVFYCAESVLLPEWRGHGVGHKFFDAREAHARAHGFKYSAFCGVIRPADHPARPADYRPLDAFWDKRGYRELPGVLAEFSWKDIGALAEDVKALQFRIRPL